MAVSTQGFSSFSADAVTYIAEKTLLIAKKAVIFQQLGDKAVLPSGNSKTFQYTRYDRLALPLNSLTDGTTPDNTSMSISTVTAVADQWGAYVNLSDVAVLTIKHPVLVKAIDLMGYQAAETYDREIIKVLLAGTAVVFPGAVTVRSGLGAGDVVTTATIRTAVSELRSLGAMEYDGTDFVGVVDPFVEMDLSADSTFQLAASYSNIKVLQNGEIGRWMGVRWMRSNLIPRFTGLAAGSYSATGSDGSFATANYRITTVYYDALTGFINQYTANTAVSVTSTNHIAYTAPSNTAYVYKVFIGAAAGSASAVMFQGVESTLGTGFIPASTAAVFLAPPSSGDSIAGSDIPASAIVVHPSWIFGKEAYTVVDLAKLQTYVTPNQASDSDPLAQRRKAGWKYFAKSVINNQNFLKRIESASAFS